MFNRLQSLAAQGVKEKVNKTEFTKGIEEVKRNILVVKMTQTYEGNLIFTKGFDCVTVTVTETDDGLLELQYKASDNFFNNFVSSRERDFEEFQSHINNEIDNFSRVINSTVEEFRADSQKKLEDFRLQCEQKFNDFR